MANTYLLCDAKNNFGGLLEMSRLWGVVDITKHGRLVAVVLSPRAHPLCPQVCRGKGGEWGKKHMIPRKRARRTDAASAHAASMKNRRDTEAPLTPEDVQKY